jgi:hypothetical protein
MTIMTDEWFPYVTRDMKAKHGWESYYYGNVSTVRPPSAPSPSASAAQVPPSNPAPAPGPVGGQRAGGRGGGRGQFPACSNVPAPEGVTRGWATFEHGPRFHNNYVGLRNRFALLSEAYAYATFEDRVKATSYFLEGTLDFAARNAARLKKAIADADRAKVAGTVLATTAKMKQGGMVDILMGEVEPEKNPNNGADMCRRKDVTRVEKMVDMLWFEPATTETVPAAYYVPADAARAVELLKAHGVQMKEGRVAGPIEAFVIKTNAAGQTFEGHAMRKIDGAWGAAPKISGDAKYLEIRTDQPLGRLAFYLLEPASDDGLVAWNYLDDQLKDATIYPILRRR